MHISACITPSVGVLARCADLRNTHAATKQGGGQVFMHNVDVSSIASVRAFADKFLAQHNKVTAIPDIDLLGI